MRNKYEMVEVGYCIGKKWWNNGIAVEALNKIIEYLFNEVSVNRIEAYHVPENRNSGKVMIKCGMEYEGLIKQGFKNNKGKLCDIELYGIIANDYFNK